MAHYMPKKPFKYIKIYTYFQLFMDCICVPFRWAVKTGDKVSNQAF